MKLLSEEDVTVRVKLLMLMLLLISGFKKKNVVRRRILTLTPPPGSHQDVSKCLTSPELQTLMKPSGRTAACFSGVLCTYILVTYLFHKSGAPSLFISITGSCSKICF